MLHHLVVVVALGVGVLALQLAHLRVQNEVGGKGQHCINTGMGCSCVPACRCNQCRPAVLVVAQQPTHLLAQDGGLVAGCGRHALGILHLGLQTEGVGLMLGVKHTGN